MGYFTLCEIGLWRARGVENGEQKEEDRQGGMSNTERRISNTEQGMPNDEVGKRKGKRETGVQGNRRSGYQNIRKTRSATGEI